MKKGLWTILMLGLIFSCKTETAEYNMTVSGKVKGLKKGTLYLQHVPDSLLVTVDSVEIRGDENYSFTTSLESPEIFYLHLDKKDNNTINDRKHNQQDHPGYEKPGAARALFMTASMIRFGWWDRCRAH